MQENTVTVKNNSRVTARIKVSNVFQNQLKIVFNDYIEMKDNLVDEKTDKVIMASKNLLQNLSKVDMKLLEENDAHSHWMTLQKDIKSTTNAISKTADIIIQRNHFKELSSNLINAIQIFGINKKVYVEFCPMANSNQGAYWLSKEEKVINPYFGEAMLTCGEVKQIIE